LPAVGAVADRDSPPNRISGPTSASYTGGSTPKPSWMSRFAAPIDFAGLGRSASRTIASAIRSGWSTGGGGRPTKPA
jgi:hypothetical protein